MGGTFRRVFGAAAMDYVCYHAQRLDSRVGPLLSCGGVCEKTLQCNSLPDQDNDMVRETGLIVAWVEIDF